VIERREARQIAPQILHDAPGHELEPPLHTLEAP
jgi:hypothetical protein